MGLQRPEAEFEDMAITLLTEISNSLKAIQRENERQTRYLDLIRGPYTPGDYRDY
ncbi:MAG TPA: hypothetical protein VGW40_01075 [Allosphingosinicella sp.]|nr:hypothetical protein [Allosphingosinicella sp.]